MFCFEEVETFNSLVVFIDTDYIIERSKHLSGVFISRRYSNGSGSKREPKWNENEAILLVCEYFRIKNSDQTTIDKSINKISKILRIMAITEGRDIDDRYRNVKGIELQLKNLFYIDPLSESAGLPNGSILLKDIFKEYVFNSQSILAKENAILTNLLLKFMKNMDNDKEDHL